MPILTTHPCLPGCSFLVGAAFLGGLQAAEPLVSISPFPYELSAAAVERVSGIVRDNADVYTVQLDNGIPWEAALEGKEFSSNLKEEWERHKHAIAKNHRVYLAIAPLEDDRTSWAKSFEGTRTPAWAQDEKRLRDEMKRAYVAYVVRAVEYFQPEFLNIGVEAGDMAAKKPAKWPLMEELFDATLSAVRKKQPSIKVGISFGLPFLMRDGVFERAEGLIKRSDYLGISFYPYMGEFYRKLGCAQLVAPPEQWRGPLDWLKQKSPKPIVICETGYSSRDVNVKRYDLAMKGDPDSQSNYIEDLARIARRDSYPLVVMFLSVDCDKLVAQIPPEAGDVARLWQHSGFFDKDFRPKPAWGAYQRAWRGKNAGEVAALMAAPSPSKSVPVEKAAKSSFLGFASEDELFEGPRGSQIQLAREEPGGPGWMRWKYTYTQKEFAWAFRKLPARTGAGSAGLGLEIRSDRSDPLLLQVEEVGGEAFFCVLAVTEKWEPETLTWDRFQVDPAKKRDGKLDPAEIASLLIADGAASDRGATGSRSVEVRNLRFLPK